MLADAELTEKDALFREEVSNTMEYAMFLFSLEAKFNIMCVCNAIFYKCCW